MSLRSERGEKANRTGRSGERFIEERFDHDFEWTPRKDTIDKGIDYNVEIPATKTMPSFRFLAQVKTGEDVRRRKNGSWSVSIKRERYESHLRNRHPVFLIGVDRSTGEARWCEVRDAQALIPSRASPALSKTVSFSLKATDTLGKSDKARFELAVRAAQFGLDAMYGNPVAALNYRRAQLEEKDPRFKVDAAVHGDTISYWINPVGDEPTEVSFELALRSEDAERFREAVEFGLPHGFRPLSLDFTGSALFEQLSVLRSYVWSERHAKGVCTWGFGRTVRTSDPLGSLMKMRRSSAAIGVSSSNWKNLDCHCSSQ